LKRIYVEILENEKIFFTMEDRTLLVDLFSQKWIDPELRRRFKLGDTIIEDTGFSFGEKRTVCGMIEQIRKQTDLTFVSLTDGTCLLTLQLVFDNKIEGISDEYKKVTKSCTKGATLCITGTIVESQGKGQEIDMVPDIDGVKVFGLVDDPATYPISKNKLKPEYLRRFPHLRIRTRWMAAIARIRSTCSFETHKFFRDRKFQYIHTPLITSSDCEGAGEAFRVTSLKPGETDLTKDFFGKEASLTVSGQLNVETFASYLSNVYTFGPTFRAEESNTSRHLAEFWMIEPEIAYAGLDDVVELATAYLKHCVGAVLEQHEDELGFLQAISAEGLVDRLKSIQSEDFHRMTYTEAVDLLMKHIKEKKITVGIPEKIQKSQKHKTFFEFDVKWGDDLASEAEKYLTDVVFKKPVILTNYPRDIKAFYMKEDEGGDTVQAMDILVPGIGEIIGGSAREEDYERLLERIKEQGISADNLSWYLDTRRYGTMPHGGFGLGFERLVMMVTGMTNIRDVIPFPRYPKHCDC
jgi:asparaginyl-tRNA synthetase